MIAVDTSALFAIALEEKLARRCEAALENANQVLISAATLTETLIVAARHGVSVDLHKMIEYLAPHVIGVDQATAFRVERIYQQWGNGFHDAALNFGDCFAYDVAREHACPLLYVGNDFALTDIARAI